MIPIIRKAAPKPFVSHSPFAVIFLLINDRVVAKTVLRKITGKACPKPNISSNKPPWNAVGAVNIVNNTAGKTIESEQGPKATEITKPKRNEPIIKLYFETHVNALNFTVFTFSFTDLPKPSDKPAFFSNPKLFIPKNTKRTPAKPRNSS